MNARDLDLHSKPASRVAPPTHHPCIALHKVLVMYKATPCILRRCNCGGCYLGNISTYCCRASHSIAQHEEEQPQRRSQPVYHCWCLSHPSPASVCKCQQRKPATPLLRSAGCHGRLQVTKRPIKHMESSLSVFDGFSPRRASIMPVPKVGSFTVWLQSQWPDRSCSSLHAPFAPHDRHPALDAGRRRTFCTVPAAPQGSAFPTQAAGAGACCCYCNPTS
jgi:hypothetical protein